MKTESIQLQSNSMTKRLSKEARRRSFENYMSDKRDRVDSISIRKFYIGLILIGTMSILATGTLMAF
jgi:hypothetical protein